MPLDYDMLMALPPWEVRHAYTKRDTILYALGVGAAIEHPADRDELRHVYEKALEALPTMAVVLAYPGFWQKEPQYKLDWTRIVHGEQAVEIHNPIPCEGEGRSVVSIDEIFDKGELKKLRQLTKGALSTRCSSDAFSNMHCTRSRNTT